jgi:uncharacterized protein
MRHGDRESGQGALVREALRSMTREVTRRPKTVLWLTFVATVVCVLFTSSAIEFKTDRADLIDPQAAFQRRWIEYTESFGNSQDVVVAVEAQDPEAIKEVLDHLGARMEREADSFSNILYKFEPDRLREKGLQFLSPQQLATGLERIAPYRPILQGNWDLTELGSLYSRRLRFHIEKTEQTESTDELDALLQHATLLSNSLAGFLEDRNEFLSPWPEFLPVERNLHEEPQQVIYFLNDAGDMGFLRAFLVQDAKDFNGPTRAIKRLRELIGEVNVRYPHARIGLTGIPVLESDEMRKSQSDMLKASIISVLGVGLLLFLGFRGVRHPLLALVMLAASMSWAFGYTTLAVGHLNILSVSFAVILIGLGIDFAIHYLDRYLELRHEGHQLRPALLETSASVGPGIVTAAITTALAFLCAAFTQFLGVAELGVIAGGGILICALATFAVLPPLVALADRNVEPRKLPTPFQATLLRMLTSRRPWAVTIVSLAAIAAVSCQGLTYRDGQVFSRVKHDYNLLHLQADGLQSVEVQKRIFQKAKGSLLFAVSVADTPEDARRLREQFEALDTVHRVEELASHLPDTSVEETALLIQALHAELSHLPAEPPRLAPPQPQEVGQAVEDFYVWIRDKPHPLAKRAALALDSFLTDFDKLELPGQVQFLTEYQYRMTAALFAQFRAIAEASDPEPVTLADLPPAMTSRFVSAQQRWLLQIYPRDQVWDIEPLGRFVADVRSVDPDVTGTPLQNFEAARQIKDSYELAALYALAVTCGILLISYLGRRHMAAAFLSAAAVTGAAAFAITNGGDPVTLETLAAVYVGATALIAAVLDVRSVRDTVLTMLPPLAGGALTFGMLGWLGVDLNPANMIVLPLVLGIGVDDGVHVMHDFRTQRGTYRTKSSTINAIILTSLTSMIGFGSMMVAAHRGLYSLGLVLVVGVGSCLFVSLVTLPAILTLISKNRPAPGRRNIGRGPHLRSTGRTTKAKTAGRL